MSAQDAAPVPPGPDPVTNATGTEKFSWTKPSPLAARLRGPQLPAAQAAS